MIRSCHAAAAIIGAATLAAATAATAQTPYTVELLPQFGEIVQLPTPPGLPPLYSVSGSSPTGITNDGIVAGNTAAPRAMGSGWQYNTNTGAQTDLNDQFGFLGSTLSTPNANGISLGFGFNDANDFNTAGTSFTFQNGNFTALQPLISDPFAVPAGSSINDSNVIVGTAPSTRPANPFDPASPRAVVWDSPTSQPTQLAFPGGTQSFANQINNNGTVIGRADTPDTDFLRSVQWNTDGTFTFAPTVDFDGGDPSLPGFAEVVYNDINDNGTKVGKADRAIFQRYPVIVDADNNATLLPTFQDPLMSGYAGDEALVVSNNGVIGGRGRDANAGFALLWPDANAQPINLDALYGTDDITLTRVVDINDLGQVLVAGNQTVTFDGNEFVQPVAVLLNPIPAPTTAAPLALLAAGAATRRRR